MDRRRSLDIHLRSGWRRGPAAAARGPLLISYTEFTPHTLRDVPHIYLAAERLRRACRELDGAVGVAIYWQPFHRRGGSLSAWEDEAALRRFVSLPYHLEIMRRYRSRGSLRTTTWKALGDGFRPSAALRQGQVTLDA